MPPVGELLTMAQAAEFLGVCTHTMSAYYKSGRLPAIKRVRRVFFRREDLEGFLQVTGEPAAQPQKHDNRPAKQYLRSKGHKV